MIKSPLSHFVVNPKRIESPDHDDTHRKRRHRSESAFWFYAEFFLANIFDIIIILIGIPFCILLLYVFYRAVFIDGPTPAQIAQEEADRKDMERLKKEDEEEEERYRKHSEIEEARSRKDLTEYAQQLQREEDQKKLEREAEAAKKAKDQAKDTDR